VRTGRECIRSAVRSTCTLCAKSKLKCDREQPCSRCVSRGHPELCAATPVDDVKPHPAVAAASRAHNAGMYPAVNHMLTAASIQNAAVLGALTGTAFMYGMPPPPLQHLPPMAEFQRGRRPGPGMQGSVPPHGLPYLVPVSAAMPGGVAPDAGGLQQLSTLISMMHPPEKEAGHAASSASSSSSTRTAAASTASTAAACDTPPAAGPADIGTVPKSIPSAQVGEVDA